LVGMKFSSQSAIGCSNFLLGKQGAPLQSQECKGIRHAEKLSPQEQCATALGLVTLKPPF
jgi:hypothetical protein